MHRLWIALGGLFGFAAVALSAWAAHAGPRVLDAPALATLGTAVQLLGWHAPSLVAAGLLAERRGRLAHAAAGLLAVGALLFVGALTLRALSGVSLGPAAPTGGVALMLGWGLLAAAAVRR